MTRESLTDDLLNDVRKFYGAYPFDVAGNICQHDGWFMKSLVRKWGESTVSRASAIVAEELRKSREFAKANLTKAETKITLNAPLPKDLSEVRKNWIESQYDAIMSNDPGNYVWNRLRDEARDLTVEQLRKWQEEQEQPDQPQRGTS